MSRVDILDIATRLTVEFPKTGIKGRAGALHFSGTDAVACRARAEKLMQAAKVCNAHQDLGHMRSKRNWWKCA